jgi:hypothetical protein
VCVFYGIHDLHLRFQELATGDNRNPFIFCLLSDDVCVCVGCVFVWLYLSCMCDAYSEPFSWLCSIVSVPKSREGDERERDRVKPAGDPLTLLPSHSEWKTGNSCAVPGNRGARIAQRCVISIPFASFVGG